MVKMHQMRNGGAPVQLDRVVRSMGYQSAYDEEFAKRLSVCLQVDLLEGFYFRNQKCLRVTPVTGESWLYSCVVEPYKDQLNSDCR